MVLRSSFNNKYIFVFDLIAKGTNLTSKYQSCGFYFAIIGEGSDTRYHRLCQDITLRRESSANSAVVDRFNGELHTRQTTIQLHFFASRERKG